MLTRYNILAAVFAAIASVGLLTGGVAITEAQADSQVEASENPDATESDTLKATEGEGSDALLGVEREGPTEARENPDATESDRLGKERSTAAEGVQLSEELRTECQEVSMNPDITDQDCLNLLEEQKE